MSDRSRCRRGGRSGPAAQSPAPVPQEPPVRRWPHPVDGAEPPADPDPALHYIRCALSYQDQLLADIRTLLLQLLPEDGQETPEGR